MATPILPSRLKAYTGAGAHLLDAFAQNAVITVSHGSAASVTLPDASSVDFPLGTVITVIQVVQVGAGAVTVTVPGSDTIAGTAATAAAGDTLFLTKTTATGWHSALAT